MFRVTIVDCIVCTYVCRCVFEEGSTRVPNKQCLSESPVHDASRDDPSSILIIRLQIFMHISVSQDYAGFEFDREFGMCRIAWNEFDRKKYEIPTKVVITFVEKQFSIAILLV